MPLTVAGSDRSRMGRRITTFLAGPEAASIALNAAATSGSVGLTSGGGAWPTPTRTSSTARPRSEWRS